MPDVLIKHKPEVVYYRSGADGDGADNTPMSIWEADCKTIGDGCIFKFRFLNDDVPADVVDYAQFIVEIVSPVDTLESGKLKYSLVREGVMTDVLEIDEIGRATISGPLKTGGYLVADLAGLTGVTQGDRTFVTDANGPVHLAVVVGGGGTCCPVFYNGANWIVA